MTVSPPGAAPAATIGRRVGAFAIDIGVAWVIGAVLVGIVVGIIFGVGPAWQRDGLAVMILLSYAGIGLLLFAWWLVYSAMQGSRGGSIGQRILGLRLHDASSAAPIGFWRAILRNLVFSLAASIVVGYFTPLFDASGRRQGWHDMASRAVVVDVRKMVPAAALAAMTAANPYLPHPAGAAPLAPAPPLQPAPLPAAAFTRAAGPATTRPAAPMPTGVIADLPWITHEPPFTRAAEPFPDVTMPFPAATTTEPLGATATATAIAPAAAPAFAAGPTRPEAPRDASAARGGGVGTVAPSVVEEDVESTRIVVPPPAQRAALYDGAPVLAVLTWDDGTRMAVYGRTLYGRNPASEDGAVAIPVRDETLSLSKTHFEVGGDTAGTWIADRHSTNGTTLVRDGGRIPLTPGVRTNLRDGDTLEFGDRRVTVGLAR
ncbi:putative RDD family membrane protein YckC [Microbacterium trichothecenolyticum]|uniref:RDD family protein n=1 Tax=Microbacterium trichothecenolyticum TaxID=69370 RepID=UPI002865F542|nr:RDD family protein [Microbacterium trichothecenolyticum]MDR7184552.1 putative RDD family membrane protein YckC [Microbacterium trichothecenolyticum]